MLAARRTPATAPCGARGRLNRDRGEDDAALQRPFPVGTRAKEGQRRARHAEQHGAEDGTGDRAAPAGDRGAADHDGGDDLHLEAQTRVGRNLREPDGVDDRRERREHAGDDEHGEPDRGHVDRRQPRRFGIRPRGVHHAAGSRRSKHPERQHADSAAAMPTATNGYARCERPNH